MTPALPARDHTERHQRGLEVLRTLGDTDAPDKAARFMVNRYGPLGSCATDLVAGDCWGRHQLSRRDRSLIVVSLLAAQGADEELELHARAALTHGCRREEVEEALLTVAGYVGFPMAMAAARVVEEVWKSIDGVDRLPRRAGLEPLGDVERRRRAAIARTAMTGSDEIDPDDLASSLIEQFGGVGEMLDHWILGELWSRPQLTRRDRSLVVLALLGLLRCHDEVRDQARAALRHGATRSEVEEVCVQLSLYAGVPRAIEAITIVRATWDEIDDVGR